MSTGVMRARERYRNHHTHAGRLRPGLGVGLGGISSSESSAAGFSSSFDLGMNNKAWPKSGANPD